VTTSPSGVPKERSSPEGEVARQDMGEGPLVWWFWRWKKEVSAAVTLKGSQVRNCPVLPEATRRRSLSLPGRKERREGEPRAGAKERGRV